MSSDYPIAPVNSGLASTSNLQTQSVSQVAGAIKRTVEQAFDRVRIRGEVSRPTYARSGHLYFTLKDEKAVIDTVAWKGQVARFNIRLEEGLEIIAEGRLTTYPGSSKYQLVMDRVEVAGEGALLKLLEDRKRKLQAEGLFADERKQALPFMPRVIGVVTSPTGAVIRDILHRLRDRFPVHVLVWPVAVQGKGAEHKIADAIRGFDALTGLEGVPRPDTLIVARGGGSLEDLWCFNEEIVARAVADCRIPLISAVGHETDTTLIDFVSDIRAPTPTAAAEMAVPVRDNLLAYLDETDVRAKNAIRRNVVERRQALEGLARGLVNPERALENLTQRLDELSERLEGSVRRTRDLAGQKVTDLAARLPQAWARQVQTSSQRLTSLDVSTRMPAALKRLVSEKQRGLEGQYAKLLSFEQAETRALERGYARVWAADGTLVTSVKKLPKEGVELEFHDGRKALAAGVATKPKRPAPKTPTKEQGSLF